jgi:CRISPR-associated protein Cmr1
MTVISATYRVVTPMFLGDANQKATGLRPPSVRGRCVSGGER